MKTYGNDDWLLNIFAKVSPTLPKVEKKVELTAGGLGHDGDVLLLGAGGPPQGATAAIGDVVVAANGANGFEILDLTGRCAVATRFAFIVHATFPAKAAREPRANICKGEAKNSFLKIFSPSF